MVANQSWGEGRKTQKGMHTVKETGLLAAKIDLLMKRLDEQATDPTTSTVQDIDSCMTCEECGNVGHMGINCPRTHETHRSSTTGSANNSKVMGGTTRTTPKVITLVLIPPSLR